MIKIKDVEEEKLNTLMPILLKKELNHGNHILMLMVLEEELPPVLMMNQKLFSQIKESDLFLKMILKLCKKP